MKVSSKLPRKQRRFLHRAPLHHRHHFLHAPLSPELRKDYGRRSFRVAKGDRVRILRGDEKGHEGEVQSVDLRDGKIVIEGIVVTKADGSEVPKPVHPSNVMIVKLNLKDKLRSERLSR
jgi:large subunit ribosomal protein L24